ncbi:MAG: isochorismate synthase [Anaerolineae bacterium]|nr:isochorismate synthase [Anaerolineae bacterium]NUQ02427.1 isochorismate synthase [Anaerolineae bacterium]
MNEPRLVSVSRRCDGVSAEALLASARGRERFYWNQDDLVYVGIGVAAEITAWGERRFAAIEEKARTLFSGVRVLGGAEPMALPRLFGGFSFQPDFITEHTWAQFAPAYFVLPHYQLFRRGETAWLTLNVQIAADELLDEGALRAALDAECALAQQSTSSPIVPAAPLSSDYPMSLDEWTGLIESARSSMKAGALNKVVLARVCELRFAERVNVEGALDYLNDAYSGCYRFLFEPIPHLAFFGATPELLVRTSGKTVETMALAGSIRRGGTLAEDEALGASLLADPKERHEHALVVEGIRDRLTSLTTMLDIPSEPGVLRLRNIQHLHTAICGSLKAPCGVVPLAEALHPTPALGGSPRADALEFIRQREPVPRGWYAAPIGWIDSHLDGAFVVAIRSAVCQNERVWLYAGAGIVADSQPQKEWEETALKFSPMLNALGAGPDVLA